MEKDLLIDFNESENITSADGPKDVMGSNADEETQSLLDLNIFLGGTSGTKKVISYKESGDLMSPFRDRGIGNSTMLDFYENSNHVGLSPFGNSKVNNAKHFNSDFMIDSDPSKLMSPFGFPERARFPSIVPELNLQNSVPTGELLQVQEEPKLPDDLFDIAVLEKKQYETFTGSDFLQGDNISRLNLPSVPSVGSGESKFSSDGSINKGFFEVNSSVEQSDDFLSVNDSVFEEAKAIAKEFSRMAMCEPDFPLEGIEYETSSILYYAPDWDETDSEIVDMKSNSGEVSTYAKQNHENLLQEEILRSDWKSTSSLPSKDNLEAGPQNRIQRSYSSSGSFSMSPPPLSTERLDHMKLKATEVIGAPLNFTTLKTNASTRSSALSGRSGPLKAFVPLSQIVKSKLSSPVGIVPAKIRGTPQLKVIESSPDRPKQINSCTGIVSSTPKLSKPSNSSSLVRKVLTGSTKRTSTPKLNHEATSTPDPRISSSGRVQVVGKCIVTDRVLSTNKARKVSAPSPVPVRRSSNTSPNVKTPVVRSSSTGHLPLTPSMKKVNGSANTYAFPSPLRRSNSLSTKLSTQSSARNLMTASVNSPAKGSTPLDKLVSKFRRISVSRGMKENVSPLKH